MNNISNDNETTVFSGYPGQGAKGNTATLDANAIAKVSALGQSNDFTELDETANDKVYYVNEDGTNSFTLINKATLSERAAAQAQATNTPWYDTIWMTDPLTGKSLGLKKTGNNPRDDSPYQVMFVGDSAASDVDTSPQPAPLPQPLKQMSYDKFKDIIAGGFSDTGAGGMPPGWTDSSDPNNPGKAFQEMQKKVAGAKTFKEMMNIKKEILNPDEAKRRTEQEEFDAFGEFTHNGGY